MGLIPPTSIGYSASLRVTAVTVVFAVLLASCAFGVSQQETVDSQSTLAFRPSTSVTQGGEVTFASPPGDQRIVVSTDFRSANDLIHAALNRMGYLTNEHGDASQRSDSFIASANRDFEVFTIWSIGSVLGDYVVVDQPVGPLFGPEAVAISRRGTVEGVWFVCGQLEIEILGAKFEYARDLAVNIYAEQCTP